MPAPKFSLKHPLAAATPVWACLWLALVVGLTSGASTVFAQGGPKQDENGEVTFKGRKFPNLKAFHNSQVWRDSGLRCEAMSAMARRASGPSSSDAQRRQQRVEDCTLALTTISTDYNPLQGDAFVVPVYFHVIYRTDGTGLLTQQQVDAQIAVLNMDFASQYTTSITFELAGTTFTENDSWYNAGFGIDEAFKSALARDTSRYLNIYSQSAGGSLGYAYLPQSDAGEIHDGVVVLSDAVGGRNNGYSVYDQGRTLVHEVGHYLGLLHTFENGGACPNGYSSGDLILDTPPQQSEDYGTTASNTCGVPSAIDNYMNYSDDIAMDTFTAEQTNRMICSLISYRPLAYSLSSAAEDDAGSGLPIWLLYEASKGSP
jgi:hypothetical protein